MAFTRNGLARHWLGGKNFWYVRGKHSPFFVTSGLVSLRPLLVVGASARSHPFCRRRKPEFVAIQLFQQLLQYVSTAATEMDIGGLMAHQYQQIGRQRESLVARVLGHFDLRDVRRELADQPLLPNQHNAREYRIVRMCNGQTIATESVSYDYPAAAAGQGQGG